eukprot:1615622-Prorocentrum_lima.AAC.1
MLQERHKALGCRLSTITWKADGQSVDWQETGLYRIKKETNEVVTLEGQSLKIPFLVDKTTIIEANWDFKKARLCTPS